MPPSVRPARVRVLFARHRMSRTGCGVLRVCSMQAIPREASGNTALPPLRAERANAPMRDQRAPLMCTARRFCHSASKTRVHALMGGLGANKSPRWSAERRTSRVMGRRAPALAPAGVRHSPADGCRCTRAPVGAPLPSFVEREHANLGGPSASRERSRMACVAVICSILGRSRVSLRLGVRYTRSRHDHP